MHCRGDIIFKVGGVIILVHDHHSDVSHSRQTLKVNRLYGYCDATGLQFSVKHPQAAEQACGFVEGEGLVDRVRIVDLCEGEGELTSLIKVWVNGVIS